MLNKYWTGLLDNEKLAISPKIKKRDKMGGGVEGDKEGAREAHSVAVFIYSSSLT